MFFFESLTCLHIVVQGPLVSLYLLTSFRCYKDNYKTYENYFIFQNFCSRADTVFCGVFDGHGLFGHMVAKKVRDTLPSTLSTQLKLASESEQSGLVNEEEEGQRSESVTTTMAEQWCELNPNGEQLPEMCLPLKHALLKSCQQIDKELKMHPTIDCFCSGTTSVTLIKQVLSHIFF